MKTGYTIEHMVEGVKTGLYWTGSKWSKDEDNACRYATHEDAQIAQIFARDSIQKALEKFS